MANRTHPHRSQGSGHDERVIDHARCVMDITSKKPSAHYSEEEFDARHFDAVIPHIGASVSFYGCAVVRQSEMMGSYCVNNSVAITRARDKLRSLQLLSRKGIGIPATSFANSPDGPEGLILEFIERNGRQNKTGTRGKG